MYELSTIQVVPDSFQVATAKDPCNYGANGGVPDSSIQVATAKESPNTEGDNSGPYQCDIMPSSPNEDETASIVYLKKNPDPSLTYWDGVTFHKSENALNDSLLYMASGKALSLKASRKHFYTVGFQTVRFFPLLLVLPFRGLVIFIFAFSCSERAEDCDCPCVD
jgi:hypothetical protein